MTKKRNVRLIRQLANGDRATERRLRSSFPSIPERERSALLAKHVPRPFRLAAFLRTIKKVTGCATILVENLQSVSVAFAQVSKAIERMKTPRDFPRFSVPQNNEPPSPSETTRFLVSQGELIRITLGAEFGSAQPGDEAMFRVSRVGTNSITVEPIHVER